MSKVLERLRVEIQAPKKSFTVWSSHRMAALRYFQALASQQEGGRLHHSAMPWHPDRSIPTPYFFITLEAELAAKLLAQGEHTIKYPALPTPVTKSTIYHQALADFRPLSSKTDEHRTMVVTLKKSPSTQQRDRYGLPPQPRRTRRDEALDYQLGRAMAHPSTGFQGFADPPRIADPRLIRIAEGTPPRKYEMLQERYRKQKENVLRKKAEAAGTDGKQAETQG